MLPSSSARVRSVAVTLAAPIATGNVAAVSDGVDDNLTGTVPGVSASTAEALRSLFPPAIGAAPGAVACEGSLADLIRIQ